MLNTDVWAFIAVVEEGSFTKAADRLGSSKARVSQQVTALEKRLGVTLLRRSTRHISLTDLGETFYSESQRAAFIMSQVTRQVSEHQGRIAGTIRLNSVGGIFAEQMLAPALIAFQKRHPEVNVNLDFASHRVDVMSERYDLAVRVGRLEDSSLVARPLIKLASYVIASPEFLAKYGRPSEPNKLTEFNCLCGSVAKWRFLHKHSNAEQEVTVKGMLNSPNGHIIRLAALEGLGVARLNQLYLDADIRKGALVPVFRDWVTPAQPVSLIYPKVRYKTRRIQVLVDFLVQWFASIELEN